MSPREVTCLPHRQFQVGIMSPRQVTCLPTDSFSQQALYISTKCGHYHHLIEM